MWVARQYLKEAVKFLVRRAGLLVLVWGSDAMAADSVRVIMQTTQGAITLELDAKAAPRKRLQTFCGMLTNRVTTTRFFIV